MVPGGSCGTVGHASGIPGLVDIPVIGNILANQNSDSKKRAPELTIVIKPQIIRTMVDARQVAVGLRQRMKGFERW